MNTALTTKHLVVRFGDKVALNSINLSIADQGVTALLGANGAGKTTLINCALGLCKPSSGELSVFNKKVGNIETKRLIGVMLQDSGLPDLLSPAEHIELFSSYYQNPLSVAELTRRCDLEGFINTRYKHLSGGQKRRVQFALAIVGRPKLVFLDEPTTGLDIDARKTVWNTIDDLRNGGTAVLLTTHYLEEADSLADHTIVMNKGDIIANDSTNNIRAAVSGSIIHCETIIDVTQIQSLQRVESAQLSGKQVEIRSQDAAASLADLLKIDPNIKNLTVTKASLEDAFIKLTKTQNKQGVQR